MHSNNPFAVAGLVLVLVVGNGLALNCTNCVSRNSFDDCEKLGDVLQCNTTIVNGNHAALEEQNPTLVQGNGTEFQCYRMEVAVLDPNNTDTGIRGYARGCTFLSTKFCTGWKNNLNVTSCTTCTTDNCDKNPAPTNAPPTTNATVPTTNPTVPNANTTLPTTISTTTTTKPAGGGASALTQISMTALGSLSIVLLLAGR